MKKNVVKINKQKWILGGIRHRFLGALLMEEINAIWYHPFLDYQNLKKSKDIKKHGFQTFIGLFQTTTFAGEISSALDRPKEMMENLNFIQISHLAFDFNWLMVPYDISIKWASLMGPHFCISAILKISMSPKRPLCSPTFANCIGKDLHALYLTNLSIVQFYFRFMDFVPFVTVWHVTFDSIIRENGFWHGYQTLSHTWILLFLCEKVILNEVQAVFDFW